MCKIQLLIDTLGGGITTKNQLFLTITSKHCEHLLKGKSTLELSWF